MVLTLPCVCDWNGRGRTIRRPWSSLYRVYLTGVAGDVQQGVHGPHFAVCILQEWQETYHKASTAIQCREEKVEDAARLIETNLVLLGATAIEDKLQDKVGDSSWQTVSRRPRGAVDGGRRRLRSG